MRQGPKKNWYCAKNNKNSKQKQKLKTILIDAAQDLAYFSTNCRIPAYRYCLDDAFDYDNQWDIYKRKGKGWKDQTKAARQWAKHKPNRKTIISTKKKGLLAMRNQPLITDLEFADGNYLLDICSTMDLDLIDIARETKPNTYIFTDLSADKNLYYGEDILQCLTKVIEHPAIEDYIESYIGISPEEQFDKWRAKIVKEETQKTTLTLTNNQRKWLDKNYIIDIEMTQVYQTGTLDIANWQPGANPLGYYDAFRVDDTDYCDTVPTFSIRPVETIDYLKTNLTFSQLEAFIEELIEKEYIDELTQSFKAVIELPELISKDLTLSVRDLDSQTYVMLTAYDDRTCLLDALSGDIIALNGEEVQINFYRSKNQYTLINPNLDEGRYEIEYRISPFIFKNHLTISDVIYDNRFDKS